MPYEYNLLELQASARLALDRVPKKQGANPDKRHRLYLLSRLASTWTHYLGLHVGYSKGSKFHGFAEAVVEIARMPVQGGELERDIRFVISPSGESPNLNTPK